MSLCLRGHHCKCGTADDCIQKSYIFIFIVHFFISIESTTAASYTTNSTCTHIKPTTMYMYIGIKDTALISR